MCVLDIIFGLIYDLTFDVNKGICSPPWSFNALLTVRLIGVNRHGGL